MSYAYAMMGLGQAAGADLDAWRRDYGLARDAGIPVAVVRAIKGHESGGNPAAIRFEPHVFWRKQKGLPSRATGPEIRAALTAADMAAVPYTPGNLAWRTAHGLPRCPNHDRAASCTGSETGRTAFNRAFAINPRFAVEATSWGSGQVLGGHLLEMFGGDPRRAVDGFYADPTGVGDRAFVSWWRDARADTVAAANATPPNMSLVGSRYNGCTLGTESCTRYVSGIQRAYNEAASAWERVRAAVEAAGALTTGASTTIVSTVRRNPMTTALIGATVLSAGAAFAWWAYSKSKVSRNRKRRRISRNGARVPWEMRSSWM